MDCDYSKLVILLIANGLQSMHMFLQGVFSEIICKAGACQMPYLAFFH